MKGGKIIDIEGNYDSPINEGTLCPKGANTFQLTVNPHRIKKILYRAPYSDHWEERPLDWAMDRIAQLIKETRDRDFKEKNDQGVTVNHVTTLAWVAGFVDVVGYLSLSHLFLAHMSGNSAAMGAYFGQGRWSSWWI